MKEDLITFETAKLAKEKGFKVPTKQYYEENGDLCQYRNSLKDWNNLDPKKYSDMKSAPTQSLLQRWLRDVHKIDIYILGCGDGYYAQLNNVPPSNQGDVKYIDRRWNMPPKYINDTFKTYEEALEKGLQKSLTLIK